MGEEDLTSVLNSTATTSTCMRGPRIAVGGLGARHLEQLARTCIHGRLEEVMQAILDDDVTAGKQKFTSVKEGGPTSSEGL